MPILIDGYNLLNATGIVGAGFGPGSLQRSRLALLNFLATSIDPREVTQTTVVFDAHDPPPGLPRTVEHRGITVRFAARTETADELIANLIRDYSAPRTLVVVSSDHAVQRAAHRRKAKAVDSDVWYADLTRARRDREQAATENPARPAVPLLEEDVNYWLREFGGESTLTALLAQTQKPESQLSSSPAGSDDLHSLDDLDKQDVPLDNPFPPGYGEDILREW